MKECTKKFIKQQKADIALAYENFTPRQRKFWFLIGIIIGQLL
jgi:hypothetical protein